MHAKIPPRILDPREIERGLYDKNIRDHAKYSGDILSFSYNRKISFEYYLAYFLMQSMHTYLETDCTKKIDDDHAEFDLVYFMPQFKKYLKKFCSYSVQKLVNIGNEYANKSQNFDHYDMLFALLFQYFQFHYELGI